MLFSHPKAQALLGARLCIIVTCFLICLLLVDIIFPHISSRPSKEKLLQLQCVVLQTTGRTSHLYAPQNFQCVNHWWKNFNAVVCEAQFIWYLTSKVKSEIRNSYELHWTTLDGLFSMMSEILRSWLVGMPSARDSAKVQLIGLSCDSVVQHKAWSKETSTCEVCSALESTVTICCYRAFPGCVGSEKQGLRHWRGGVMEWLF